MTDIDKVWASADEAVADIAGGTSLAVGGSGLAGVPIDALNRTDADDLKVASNNCGVGGGPRCPARAAPHLPGHRAAGTGIPGFDTPAGVGTMIADGGHKSSLEPPPLPEDDHDQHDRRARNPGHRAPRRRAARALLRGAPGVRPLPPQPGQDH